MRPSEELEQRGWPDSYAAFEEIVCDTAVALYPAWSVDTLLQHPDDAAEFCKAVLVKAPLTGRRREVQFLICRVLTNNRKNRDNRLRVADREPDLFEDAAP